MKQEGFSLVEVLTVIAIAGILVAIGTLQFNRMTRKSSIEGQVQKMYGDLINIRSEAVFKKRARLVKLSTTGYTIYPSNVDTDPPLLQQNLSHAITWSDAETIVFDTQGMTTEVKAICIDPIDTTASFDSIVITESRIHMGRRTGGCTSGNIALK